MGTLIRADDIFTENDPWKKQEKIEAARKQIKDMDEWMQFVKMVTEGEPNDTDRLQ